MPFNGAGVFQRVRNWTADAFAGIKIRADFHDAEDDGFAAGLTNCITRDGQSIITQNIPFNSKRATGLADPINDQDASTKKYADTKLSSTSDNKMDGDLTINTVGGTSADNRINGTKDGLLRWMLALGYGDPEAAGNIGSDFYLYRYNNAGADPGGGPVLTFSRATGLGLVAGDPTSLTGIATKRSSEAAAAAAVFPRVLRGGDTMLGALQSFGSGGGINYTAAMSNSFNVVNTVGVSHAYMTFYASGFFGANFGIDGVGDFRMGGLSHGNTTYKFWTTKDFNYIPTRQEAFEALEAVVESLTARIAVLESRGAA